MKFVEEKVKEKIKLINDTSSKSKRNCCQSIRNLEKELSSGNIDPKLFAKKSKEYSNLGNIISIAKEYLNFDNEKKGFRTNFKDKKNDKEIIEMAEKDLNEMK